MKLHTTIEAINKSIESINRRGKQLDQDIQVTGVSILAHINEHSDATILDRLVQAMPKGSRKGALCEWACAFGKVRMLDRELERDAAAIEAGRLFKFDKTKETDIQGAWDNHWTSFKPEKDLLDTFDAAKAISQLMSKLMKATRSGVAIENVPEAMKTLKAMEQTFSTQMATLEGELK